MLSVLKLIQGSEVFEDFSGTFLLFKVKKITFLKGDLCMYKCFKNVV